MTERLQKILSARGICARRKAEELISFGRVTVNGVTALLGSSADPEQDTILVDGKPLPPPEGRVYIMLNKPRGYVTTLSDEKGRPTVLQLVFDCGRRVYPIGRLDMDSEGLLLLTDDGDFSNRLAHPKHHIEKVYLVTVRGFTADGFERLKKPVTLDGYTIHPPKLERLTDEPSRRDVCIRITIHEGRNRQIRRMCAMAGMRVTRLIRIQEGSLRLNDLPPGKWRYLTCDEVRKLKEEL